MHLRTALFRLYRDWLGLFSRKSVWDRKFRRGEFERLKGARNPDWTRRVNELARGGKIVELGCGEGELLLHIDPARYSAYTGYDISGVAIAEARRRARDAGCERFTYEALDVTRWTGDRDVGLIVVEEVIYYLSLKDQKALLARCAGSLGPAGALLIKVHDSEAHADTVATCKAALPGLTVEPMGEGACMSLIKG